MGQSSRCTVASRSGMRTRITRLAMQKLLFEVVLTFWTDKGAFLR